MKNFLLSLIISVVFLGLFSYNTVIPLKTDPDITAVRHPVLSKFELPSQKSFENKKIENANTEHNKDWYSGALSIIKKK
mgnify:FL=1